MKLKLNALRWTVLIKGTSSKHPAFVAWFPMCDSSPKWGVARWDTTSLINTWTISANPGTMFETAMEVNDGTSFPGVLSHSNSCFSSSILPAINYGNQIFTSFHSCHQETWSFNCLKIIIPLKTIKFPMLPMKFPRIFLWSFPRSHFSHLCAAPCRLAQRKAVLAAASGAKAKPRRSASSLGMRDQKRRR